MCKGFIRFVDYNGERKPLKLAILEATNGERNAKAVYSWSYRHKIDVQSAFEQVIDYFNREKKYNNVRNIIEQTGMSKGCIYGRLRNNYSEEDLLSSIHLKTKYKQPFNVKYKVVYKGQELPFKTALIIATKGYCKYSSFNYISKKKVYKGLSVQEAFEKIIKRMQIKYKNYIDADK